jgi:hypothetical protein
MRKLIGGIAILTTFLAACNSGTNSTQETKAPVDSSVAQAVVTPNGNEVATKVEVSIKDILDNYLQMKNAFAKDNDKDAATAGKEMVKAFEKFDKTSLTAEQAKTYKNIEDDAKEHAEHIGMNAGNIKHQREHFDMLSKDMYQLIKTFGAGQTVYYDHCPMYNDNKGADWISETKEIQNPYLGKSMPTCGSVKEELK